MMELTTTIINMIIENKEEWNNKTRNLLDLDAEFFFSLLSLLISSPKVEESKEPKECVE